MPPPIEIIKGLHPGFLLDRELRIRKLEKDSFADSIGVNQATFDAMLKGNHPMNQPMAMKIEKALCLDEGYLTEIQRYHDIKEEERKKYQNYKPDLAKFRRCLFWDTRMDMIDWHKHKRAVIERVFERGDEDERTEIIRFYGQEEVARILNNLARGKAPKA